MCVTLVESRRCHFRYGPDFNKPLRSLTLDEDYYTRVKNPVDIRQRMQNGDYATNLLLFERDVVQMLINALCMYPRDHGVHGHAREMLNYALELFTVRELSECALADTVASHLL